MEIFDIKQNSKQAIESAVGILKNGGVLIYPTETCYGLGCDATNKEAVKKIYKIKGREEKKSLPMIVANLIIVKKYFEIKNKSLELAEKYWPGPLTLILKVRKDVKIFFSKEGQASAAVRVSSHKIAKALSQKLGKPIISTSANVSGKPPCYNVEEVLEQFKNRKFQSDLILDAGQLKKNQPSTIVKVENDKIKILRAGKLKLLE